MMQLFRARSLPVLALVAVLAVALVAGCGPGAKGGGGGGDNGTTSAPSGPEAVAGGNPIPDGTYTVVFPRMYSKSRVSFVSDAAEVIHGVLEVPHPQTDAELAAQPYGSLEVDTEAGTATGSLAFRVSQMRTGNEMRDEHMRSTDWLDAESYPTIELADLTATRNADHPTVWEIRGTLKIHGQEQPFTTLANVRYYDNIPPQGEMIRAHAKFDVKLADFGITNQAIGTPAVAEVWQVEVSLFGKQQ